MFFGILSSHKYLTCTTEINNFPGELTDVSAERKTLPKTPTRTNLGDVQDVTNLCKVGLHVASAGESEELVIFFEGALEGQLGEHCTNHRNERFQLRAVRVLAVLLQHTITSHPQITIHSTINQSDTHKIARVLGEKNKISIESQIGRASCRERVLRMG